MAMAMIGARRTSNSTCMIRASAMGDLISATDTPDITHTMHTISGRNGSS